VAASNGFPILFTPITLRSYAERCRGVRPPFVPTTVSADMADGSSRRVQLERIVARLMDPERTRWMHLMDGGIADNLGLRGLLNLMIGLDINTEMLRRQALRTRRILVVSVDGQAAADPTLNQQRVVTGLGQIFSAVSGTQIDACNYETLALTHKQAKSLVERVKALRCAAGPVIDGHPCDDVKGQVIHLALSGITDPAERAKLQAIPTGLTIPREDVDALVAFGERLTREHPGIRAMLEDQPASAPAQAEERSRPPRPRHGG
jgi:NTE family protein